MGVYIKGMEMPKSCFDCPMRWKVDPDTIKCLATGERFEETFAGTIETRNRGNCPLIQVSDHGRLIDSDALEEKTDDRYSLGEIGRRERDDIVNALRYCAPTIIPASEEGE